MRVPLIYGVRNDQLPVDEPVLDDAVVFLLVAWIAVLFRIIGDVFSSSDLSGVAKAFWTLFLIVLPWLGVVVYLIVRGGNMQERRAG